jgi:hypothetical protein
VTRTGGGRSEASPDGKTLYFERSFLAHFSPSFIAPSPAHALLAVSPDGGPERTVIDCVPRGDSPSRQRASITCRAATRKAPRRSCSGIPRRERTECSARWRARWARADGLGRREDRPFHEGGRPGQRLAADRELPLALYPRRFIRVAGGLRSPRPAPRARPAGGGTRAPGRGGPACPSAPAPCGLRAARSSP